MRTLVNHVVGEERWTVPLMEGQTIADVGDSLDGDLLGDDPVTAAAAAARAAQEAAASADRARCTCRTARRRRREYLRQLAADHLIHGWDLAVAIGAERPAGSRSWWTGSPPGSRSGRSSTARPARSPTGGRASPIRPTSCSAPSGATRAGLHAHAASSPRFGAAFDRGDLDAVMALVTDDCVFESTSPAPDGARFEGAAARTGGVGEAVREHRTRGSRPRRPWCWVIGPSCGGRYSWQEPSGERGHVRGVDVMRLRDGKIAEKLSYVKG